MSEANSEMSLRKAIEGGRLILFSGPCVIESEDSCLWHAEQILKATKDYPIELVFKSSFDKANRTSLESFRGPGLEQGLKILAKVKSELGLKIVTDLHDCSQVQQVAEVADIVQVPAFLCRQTDLLVSCAESAKPVMVKKGQFMAPADMQFVAEKITATKENTLVLLCERGSSFGYRHLVVDFAGLNELKSLGYPVVFDATHSLQVIGGLGGKSGGRREAASSLLRAALAVGVNGLFMEVHKDPSSALSDGSNMLSLEQLKDLLPDITTLHELNLQSRENTVNRV